MIKTFPAQEPARNSEPICLFALQRSVKRWVIPRARRGGQVVLPFRSSIAGARLQAAVPSQHHECHAQAGRTAATTTGTFGLCRCAAGGAVEPQQPPACPVNQLQGGVLPQRLTGVAMEQSHLRPHQHSMCRKVNAFRGSSASANVLQHVESGGRQVARKQ